MRIEKSLIPQEVIENKIFTIRDKKAMLDKVPVFLSMPQQLFEKLQGNNLPYGNLNNSAYLEVSDPFEGGQTPRMSGYHI
ncbi:MAG: hypothetical protein V1770_04115 [bacterium]